jgi:hypothetical protein
MPFLEISDGSGNVDFGSAAFKLPAVMLFPDDANARRQWVAAAALKLLKDRPRPEQNPDFPIITPPDVLEIISQTPHPEELMSRVTDRIEQGRIAGNILNLVLSLSQFAPKHATVRKAIRVLGVHLVKQGKRAGLSLPASPSALKSIWPRFKSVSHLWAAVPSGFVEGVSGIADFAKYISPHDARSFIDRFFEFLAHAEKIRLLGENHHAPGGRNNSFATKTPMLDPDATWKVPGDLNLPGYEPTIMPPPEWVTEELKTYTVEPASAPVRVAPQQGCGCWPARTPNANR